MPTPAASGPADRGVAAGGAGRRPSGTSVDRAAPSDRGTRVAVATLAAVGAAVLAVRAVRTLGPDPYGVLAPAAAVLPAAGSLLAAAAAAGVRRGRLAVPLLGAALLAAAATELLPTAPPRLVAMVPLVAALVLRAAPGVSDRPGPPARSRPAQQAEAGGSAAGGGTQAAGAGSLAGGPSWTAAVGWGGLALHVVVAYPYLVSGLVVPGYGLLGLWASWTVLLLVAVRLRPRRPLLVPVVPVAAFGLWLAVLVVGGRLLGWQP